MPKNQIGLCINLGLLVVISGVLLWAIPIIKAEIKNNADQKAAMAK